MTALSTTSTNLLNDPSFDLSAAGLPSTYWAIASVGGSGTSITCSAAAHSGSCFTAFAAVGGLTGISQSGIAVTPGTLYIVSWWLQSDGGVTNAFEVSGLLHAAGRGASQA